MAKRKVVLALMLGGLFVACADRPMPTDVPDAAYSFVNNRPANNPMLLRSYVTNPYWWWIADDTEAGLFSFQGTSNTEGQCVTPTIITSLDLQRVRRIYTDPTHSMTHELALSKDVYITVYEGTFNDWVLTDYDCGWLATHKVAEGYGQFTATDNDLFSYNYENKNHNAYGFVASGTLELVGGGTVFYHGLNRCVWDGEDLATNKCVTRITLR